MKKIINLCLSALLMMALINVNTFSLSASGNQTSSPVQEFELNHYDKAGSAINFDSNWKFFLGDAPGAEALAFQDSTWKDINLPHDYSLSQEYTPNGEAESGYKLGGIGWYRKQFTLGSDYEGKKVYLHFDGAYMNAEVFVNGNKVAFHPYGYTAFKVDITDNIKLNELNLVAVKTNNQTPSSRWYSGSGLYRSVYLESSDLLHFESYGVKITTPELNDATRNNVKVKVETKILNESSDADNLKVKVKVFNKENSLVKESELTDAFALAQNTNTTKTVEFNLLNPTLWDVNNPYLYRFEVELYKGQQLIDKYVKEYGLRYFDFLRDTGFKLNGRNLKLKGVSMHHDQGGLGAAAYYDAIERQVIILKEMGVNSIRVTHNPSARHLKDAANRHGILLIDEAFDTWSNRKNGNSYDYSRWFKTSVEPLKLVGASASQTWAEYDVKQMTKEGLNDPSIIMWSIGNEIFEGIDGNARVSDYAEIALNLADWIDEVDGTRFVTFGDNKLKGRDARAIAVANVLAAKNQRQGKENTLKGIIGYNYAVASQYQQGYNDNPNWTIYGSETASAINSRGIYAVNTRDDNYEREHKLLTSYDERAVPWGHTAKHAWFDTITKDFVAGEYIWTGFDYLGEPTPWNKINPGAHPNSGWPSPKSSYFGIIDTAGLPKDTFYFYQSQWNDNVNTLHILPSWNRNEMKLNNNQVKVVVYSDAKAVELFRLTPDGQRGASLGRKEFIKEITPAGHSFQYHGQKRLANLELVWNVEYQDGGLEAVAYNESNQVITNTVGNNKVQNYGEASKLKLKANKDSVIANKQNLVYVEIDVLDNNDRLVANAKNNITVNVTGAGKLIALDNGNQIDHQSYQDDNRKAHAGKLVAIVEATNESGVININATSSGLSSASLSINTTVDNNSQATSNQIKKVSYAPIIYIKKGSELTLPTTVKVERANKVQENLNVNWNRPENLEELLSRPNTFTISGLINDTNTAVTLSIVVLDRVAAVLNYSTATLKGTPVVLPTTRKGVDLDGNVLEVNFPITWEAVDEARYNEVGLIKVNGKTTVFGDELNVVANIRVAEPTLIAGSNVAPLAIKLAEDTPEDRKSDTLSAVNDRNKIYRNYSGGGKNPNAWSNYNQAQAGITHSTISFGYDTAQSINQAVIYYFTDSWATTLPSSVEFSYNAGSGDDVVVSATASAVTTVNNLKKITYTFERPVPAVDFKVKFNNGSTSPRSDTKPTTGVYEIELMSATESLVKSNEAELETITVNNKNINANSLVDRTYNTEALKADVEYTPVNNAAVTLLPSHNNKIKMLVESEDHNRFNTYLINLGAKETTDPRDGSRDIEHQDVRVEAGSTEPRPSEQVEHANDGNPNTLWHSVWGNGTDIENLYLIVEVKEGPREVEALRYLPRQGSGDGSSNGRVKSYVIYSSNDKNNWQEVVRGNWENSQDWKVAEFPSNVTAKYFKLQAVETYGGRPNRYMSAAEVSLRLPKTKTDLSQATVNINPSDYEYTGSAIRPLLTISLNDVILREDIDYTLVLENNVEIGEARVKVKGIADYTGEINRSFNIVGRNVLEVREGADLGFVFEGNANTNNLYVKVIEKDIEDASLADAKANIENLGLVKVYDVGFFNKETNARVENINGLVAIRKTLSEDFRYSNTKANLVKADNTVEELSTTLNETNTIISFELMKSGFVVISNLADKQALNVLISDAEVKIAEADKYKISTINNLNQVLANARMIKDKTSATAVEVETARVALDAAIKSLIPVRERPSLVDLLEEASLIDLDILKPSSKQKLKEAMEAAEQFLESEEENPVRNAELYRLLEDAIDNKVLKANFDAFNTAIAEFRALNSENYTTSSYASVLAKINEIETAKDLEANQDVVDAQTASIRAAIAELKARFDTTQLENLYNSIKAMDLSGKTTASKKALETVLDAVKEKLDHKADLAQEDVEQLIRSLNEKYNALESLKTKELNFGTVSAVVVGEFDDEFTLEVVKLENSEMTDEHLAVSDKNNENIEVFEVTATGNYFNTSFRLTFPYDSNKELLRVVHISKINNVEVIPFKVNAGNTITVMVNDLSPFILVYKNKQDVVSTVSYNHPVSVVEKTLPNTGSERSLGFISVSLLLASLYFVMKSKKEN